MKRIVCLASCVLFSSIAVAQNDLLLLLNPNPNTDRVIFNSRTNYMGESDNLYNTSVGVIYRQSIREDWRVGGQLNIGSASDKPFNSMDEMYMRGIGFLQIPHLSTRPGSSPSP